MSRISHRHVCKYVDSFITGNKLNLIMEYCDRGDLEQHLNRTKEMKSQLNFGSAHKTGMVELGESKVWRFFI